MNDYAVEISRKAKDENSWPSVDIAHLTRLQQIAISGHQTNTVEGQLSAIIICHQLTEELLRLLLAQVNLYTQLKLYPLPYEPKSTKKQMFGGILDLVKHAGGFQNKQYILECSAELNTIRIQISHGLVQPKVLEDLSKNSEKVLSLFAKIQWLGLEAFSSFNDAFMEYLHDSDWPPNVDAYPSSYSYKG